MDIGDKQLFPMGLGTNRIRNDQKSRTALREAVALGINFIDTASAYTGGQSENVIGEVLGNNPNIFIATKGGMVAPDFHIDSRPEMLSQQLEQSLQKLHKQSIELYFLHRVDPRVPLKESILFLKSMQSAGKIKHIGLSHVTLDQIDEARTYAGIVAIENEYNISMRMHDDVVDYCQREKIIFVPCYPLQFTIANKSPWHALTKKYHATPVQLALAWLLKRSSAILPIPGSLSPVHIKENVDAAKIDVSDRDFKLLASGA